MVISIDVFCFRCSFSRLSRLNYRLPEEIVLERLGCQGYWAQLGWVAVGVSLCTEDRLQTGWLPVCRHYNTGCQTSILQAGDHTALLWIN